MLLGHLCLLTNNLLKPGSSHRDQETGALSFLMIAFQRNGFQVLEKDCPWVQAIRIHLQGTEEEFTIVSLFWLISAPRLGGLGPILRCQLGQVINCFGSLVLFHLGTPGAWVIPGSLPYAARSHVGVWSGRESLSTMTRQLYLFEDSRFQDIRSPVAKWCTTHFSKLANKSRPQFTERNKQGGKKSHKHNKTKTIQPSLWERKSKTKRTLNQLCVYGINFVCKIILLFRGPRRGKQISSPAFKSLTSKNAYKQL